MNDYEIQIEPVEMVYRVILPHGCLSHRSDIRYRFENAMATTPGVLDWDDDPGSIDGILGGDPSDIDAIYYRVEFGVSESGLVEAVRNAIREAHESSYRIGDPPEPDTDDDPHIDAPDMFGELLTFTYDENEWNDEW